ncbi:MAG: hypothetical protein ACRDHM_08810 [Actinomycetota bacterium]
MSKHFVTALVLIALGTAPAAAQTTPEPTQPCPTSEQFGTLGIAGKTEMFAPEPVPSVGHDLGSLVTPVPYHEESVTRFRYRVDVSGSTTKPFANRATVDLILSWDNDTDFDLYVYDAADTLIDSSVSTNPISGSGEILSFPDTAHCTDLRIDVVNYLGLPNSALVLEAKVKNLKP